MKEAQTGQRLYFVNAPVDFAFIGGISILTLVILRSVDYGARTPAIITWGAYLSWVVNWPHFAATNYRLYHSPENANQYPVTAKS